jgi:hypothetical protein
MTVIVPDPDDDRAYVHLFDDPVSKRRLMQRTGAPSEEVIYAAVVSKTGDLPPSIDGLRIVSELVADPAFPLEARRRAVEWLRRQGVSITVTPH